MSRRRPARGAATLSSTLVALLFAFPFVAAAQQQPPPQQNGYQRSPAEVSLLLNTIAQPRASALRDPLDATQKRRRDTTFTSKNERAIATLAPADPNPAVRLPLPSSAAGPSGGLSPQLYARSLRDWKVEDIVLLATVDGKLYARDRNTGKHRWTIEAERPMVETIYHNVTASHGDGEIHEDDFIWIVEPSQDGALYVYEREPKIGVQKLGLTVKQLAEDLSPYASDVPPVVYTAEKRNTLYTIDAQTGIILKSFSSTGSSIVDPESCRRISSMEGLAGEEQEFAGILTLGRTEYTVGISDKVTGNQICTIKYFEWSPNNRDRDLHSQYAKKTMDNKYVYSKFNGEVTAWDYTQHERKVFEHEFSAPVARVYDIVRPFHADPRDTSLVILPQPIGPKSNDDGIQNVFINTTQTGSWYALSESSYPHVTVGARKARCYDAEWQEHVIGWPGTSRALSKNDIIGVHCLDSQDAPFQNILSISAPAEVQPSEESPAVVDELDSAIPPLEPDFRPRWTTTSVTLFLTLFFLASLGGISQSSIFKPTFSQLLERIPTINPAPKAEMPSQEVAIVEPIVEEKRVRFAVSIPEEEAVITAAVGADPAESELAVDNSVTEATLPEAVGVQEPTEADLSPDGVDEAFKPKKKAHRGLRGGKKKKKKNKSGTEGVEDDTVDRIMEEVKHMGPNQSLQPDEVLIGGIQENTAIKQIHNLTIDEDAILGTGSGGTFVFKGKFQTIDVAVKRMLPQYFELASHEVSLLQHSDDHPNVIRYYTQERDQNFLYIAVELCQTSLWDLYRDGRDQTCDEDNQRLITEINTDVSKCLYQLAAGLNHLHSLRIIHRDIKPQNILIAYPKKNQARGPRFVISDFGLCKTLPDNASTLIGTTGNAGTVGWKAPELILQPKDTALRQDLTSHSRDSSSSGGEVSQGVKRSVDIFSLGCVFFYVLTGGCHPYDDEEGWAQVRELNIKKDKADISKVQFLGEEPVHLIRCMLSNKPEDRPTALQVMQHPFFWPPEKRLNFLCDCSDHWERESRDPPSYLLQRLESFALDVIVDPDHPHRAPDFLAKLDRKFIDTLGKQRKYTGDRMLDLLRALRNKKNHYEDMPLDVQARVGPLPDGYLGYWTTRFPRLLMACYLAVVETGLQGEPRFRPYFGEVAAS